VAAWANNGVRIYGPDETDRKTLSMMPWSMAALQQLKPENCPM
jgi:hypothetical protein